MARQKILGLIAGLGLALAVSASPALATTFTSPAGTAYTGVVKAKSAAPHVLLHTKNGTTITCETSAFDWQVESHGPAVTTKASVTNLSFGSCGTTTVSVLKKGTLEIHKVSGPGGYGLVTWSGFELTVAAPFTPDCKYFFQQPTSISMGGFTSSSSEGGKTSTFHLSTEKFPVGNSIFCPEWLQMTGFYTITSPDYLDFD
jgi:hypothetical protein